MSEPTESNTSSTTSRVTVDALRRDFELYAFNFLTIVTKDAERIPFRLNRAQHKVLDVMLRQYVADVPVRVIILKSRQTGISTLIQAFLFWLAHIVVPNFNALTIAHVADSVLHLFGMSRDHYAQFEARGDELPPALRVAKKHHTRREIHFADTNSHIRVELVGEVRGFTAQGLHLSEAAFYADQKIVFRAVKQCVPRRAKTVVAVESTPNGMEEFQKMYMRAKSGRSSYAAVFIAWFDDEDSLRVPATFGMEDLDEDERELMRAYGVTLDQLAWRRVTIEDECDGDKEAFLQERPSDDRSCFLASGRPAFDRLGLQFQLDNVLSGDQLPPEGDLIPEPNPQPGSPPWIFTPQRRGRLRIFRPAMKNRPTIVGVDPSEGDMKSDPTPIVALDRIALDVSAHWHGRLPPDLLAKKAVDICRYYDNALLIWEANNHGSAFGLAVQELGYPFIYYRKVSAESVAGKVTDKPGYMTSVRGKADFVHTLRKYVREQLATVKCPIIVGEMAIYVLNDRDGAEAQEGDEDNHDDTMTALGIALFAHRGNMENPLEPLREADLARVYGDVLWKIQLGIPITANDLLNTSLTCDDLIAHDEILYNRERAERECGSAGAL